MTRNWQNLFLGGQPLSPGIITQFAGLDADVATALAYTSLSQPILFSRTGELTATVGAGKFPVPFAATIVGVTAAVGTAPTGAAILVDVNKNGTTIFPTQAGRPTILAAATSTAASATPEVTTLAVGDLVSVDIDQIGSTIAGSDLTVVVLIRHV